MLPFLNRKRPSAGIIVSTRTPDDPDKDKAPDSHSSDEAISACARDLIRGVHMKDEKLVAEAMRSAFDILESMPHDEETSVSPHSYEAQKED